MTAKELCIDIGNFFGDYFEESGKLCIDNYEQVFKYDTPAELLVDWVDTLVLNHMDCKESGSIGDTWEKEVRFIFEEVLRKYPKGVRPYHGKSKTSYKAEVYKQDGTPHGSMVYLGTFDSLIEAMYSIMKHNGEV